MKRKIAGLLAALMVLSVGTTVFAADPSASASDKVDSITPAQGVEAVTKVEAPVGIVEKVDAATEKDVESAKAEVAKEQGASLLATMDIVLEAGAVVNADNPVTLTFTVSGVNLGDNIQVLHWDGKVWEKVNTVVKAANTVQATFTSLSPIAIVKMPATTDAGKGDSGVPDSPGTGSTAPVAAVLAMICLAGVAVCGKKVKFNA